MKVQPLYDRILLKRVDEKEQKKGGIIIPDSAKEKPMEGKVIAVGSGKIEKGQRVPLEVKGGGYSGFLAQSASRCRVLPLYGNR